MVCLLADWLVGLFVCSVVRLRLGYLRVCLCVLAACLFVCVVCLFDDWFVADWLAVCLFVCLLVCWMA